MKEVIWIGTSKEDLKEFPQDVQRVMGYALHHAQEGSRANNTSILKGFGSANVIEIKDNSESGTYRTVYTVEKPEYVFVIHAFHKKSKEGKEVPKKDKDKIERRLKEVDALYKALNG